jgi:4-hydroxymandelate oxidase
VSQRDLTTTVLGQTMPMPLILAPAAFHKLATPEGEIATVRAAGAHGLTMTLSTLSTTRLEDVAQAATSPLWYQLYVYKDREVTRDLVQRAEAAGYRALVLTVDTPLLGRRERDVRQEFHLPPGLSAANLEGRGAERVAEEEGQSGLAAYVAALQDPSLTWKDVDWLRSITEMPILLKGILRGDDARRAIDHGAAGVIVSNHGGRQLDTVPATIDALPGVVEAVLGRIEVLIDGGVRRGTDILKAVALGAKAVLIGRPILWGLAANGYDGAHQVIQLLRSEFDLAMALAGCPTVADITPDLIMRKLEF